MLTSAQLHWLCTQGSISCNTGKGKHWSEKNHGIYQQQTNIKYTELPLCCTTAFVVHHASNKIKLNFSCTNKIWTPILVIENVKCYNCRDTVWHRVITMNIRQYRSFIKEWHYGSKELTTEMLQILSTQKNILCTHTYANKDLREMLKLFVKPNNNENICLSSPREDGDELFIFRITIYNSA